MERGNSSNNKRPGPPDTSGKDKKRGSLKAVRTVDVVNFAEARAFEINAMHSAMESSKNSAMQRAFQSLPRNLRRRAASHNIKRLPVRLRERARREVESDPVKKGKKPDNRHKKRRPGTISQEYLRRQGTKRWLETHIWHAKRMKMVEIWGYKLADHSNENGIKSAYKSSHHQCIIQDSSYNGCLEITGPKKDISAVFDHILDPTTPSLSSARYVTGKRQFTAHLYEFDSFPQNLIAPATFLWRQQGTALEGASVDGTPMEVDELSMQGQLWIWIHPSAFESAKTKIQEAISKAGKVKDIQVKDLENSLVMFDFTGPRSTALLQAVLRPCKSETTKPYEEAHRTWDIISSLRTSSSLPPGVVLGLLVDDPRLTFPQKPEPRPTSIPLVQSKSVQDLITHWPTAVANSSIWDAQERDRLLTSIIPESKLNERRAQNLVPGTKLIPTESDSQIPVILVQREGQPQIQRAPGGGSSEYECGWTLILPKGWAMPFWKSMIFAGARPGGLRERRSFHFETRQSCFPYDFPSTAAYGVYADECKKEAQAKYERKPVAKRINYCKMGVEDPFGASWTKALKAGIEMLGVTSENVTLNEHGIWLLQTPKLVIALTETARSAGEAGLSDEKTSKLTVSSLNLAIMECLKGLLKSTLAPPSQSVQPAQRVEEALVRVGVDFLNRGTIGMNGMIYAIPEEHYKEWAARVQLRGKRTLEGRPRKEKKPKSWMDSESDDEGMEDDDAEFDDLELAIPPPGTLLGYVTTGQYCYSEGKSYGIGCCSATGLAHLIASESRQRIEMQKLTAASNKVLSKVPRMMVLVRSIRSRASRLAKLTILS
ncbi:hypothetical protein BGZ80_009548 [Entomortierella chlamydospora]|uniref:Uncharacterized protein n=1 Tax=Entomortierella chlamydospora TaxID=101097 RepID=A0A9P6MW69_9FUNG|nr:hypothetical protein BGZ80_009548 [Entomortierella chlamydospora]